MSKPQLLKLLKDFAIALSLFLLGYYTLN